MGGITESTKRYGFLKKSSTNQSGVFYKPLDKLHSLAARQQQDSCGILTGTEFIKVSFSSDGCSVVSVTKMKLYGSMSQIFWY